MNHVAGVSRNQGRVPHTRQAERREEQEQISQEPIASQMGQPAPQSARPGRVGGRRPMRPMDHQEGRDRRQVARPVQRKARRATKIHQAQAGQHRPEDLRRVEQSRIERDRVHQRGFAHEIVEKHLATGHLERDADAGEGQDQRHLPDLHDVRPHEERQQEGERHLQDLHAQDHRLGRHAIGQRAGINPHNHAGERADGRDQPQHRLIARDLEHDPADGGLLEPRADQANPLPHIELAIIRIVHQGREGPRADRRGKRWRRHERGSVGHGGPRSEDEGGA